jgi:hypothetical protein
MGYLFGQKRQKVGRLQRQAARCFLVMPEADSMELGTWCWPRVARSVGAPRARADSARAGGAIQIASRFRNASAPGLRGPGARGSVLVGLR